MFIKMLFSSPLQFLMICLILVFSICLHEYCHAWMACREGDADAAEYMTLNPFRQMGFMSLLMLAIIGIAWGAVPVNPSNLRSRWSMLKVSLAGPAANLLLLLLAAISVMLVGVWGNKLEQQMFPVFYFLINFGMYNFALMVFNLIPAPGMDGWNILSELFPGMRRISSETAKGAMLMLILLAFVSVRYLFAVGAWVMFSFLQIGAWIGGA
ncbi:MAG: site-2 protease family protein [Lentisphaeria bacterium]|nr:site-2 protease family protein [Lentisphaeria bacterium]